MPFLFHLSTELLQATRPLPSERPLDHNALFFAPSQVFDAILQSGSSTVTGLDYLNILYLKYIVS